MSGGQKFKGRTLHQCRCIDSGGCGNKKLNLSGRFLFNTIELTINQTHLHTLAHTAPHLLRPTKLPHICDALFLFVVRCLAERPSTLHYSTDACRKVPVCPFASCQDADLALQAPRRGNPWLTGLTRNGNFSRKKPVGNVSNILDGGDVGHGVGDVDV